LGQVVRRGSVDEVLAEYHRSHDGTGSLDGVARLGMDDD
jgi:hypothetical protein